MTVDCNQYVFLEARTTPGGDTWITAFPMAKIPRCDGSQAYQKVDTYPVERESPTVPLYPGDVILAHPEIEPSGKWCRLYIHAVAQNRQAIDTAVTEAQNVADRCEFGDINDGMTGSDFFSSYNAPVTRIGIGSGAYKAHTARQVISVRYGYVWSY